MPNVNKVFLIGNLTRDPELKYLPKGTAVCQFGLAINHNWKDDSGAQHEEVTFVDIEAWGKTAEGIGKYLKKGRPIYIEGRLKLDQWEDKQTKEKKSRLRVVADTSQFIDYKPKGEQAQADSGGEPEVKESAEEARLRRQLADIQARKKAAANKPPADPDLDAPDADRLPC